MTDDDPTPIVQLAEARRQRRSDYVDRDRIEDRCADIEECIADITRRSHERAGAIDPLAFELNAHVVAIRRALEAGSPREVIVCCHCFQIEDECECKETP